MTQKARERCAFWVDILLGCAITFASIVVASRIGFREAVHFARFEETRRARDLLKAVEREMAGNERALRLALEDWDADAFRNVHVVTSAFERACESEEFFLLDAESTGAVTEAYAPSLLLAIAEIRKEGGGRLSHAYARQLAFHLDQFEDARPLLAGAVARLDEELGEVERMDLWRSVVWRDEPAARSTPFEDTVAALPATRGWTRDPPTAYNGPLEDFLVSQHLAVVSLPRGPVALTFSAGDDDSGTPVTLHLCFAQRAPFLRAVRPGGLDDVRLRRLLEGDSGPGGFVLSIPYASLTGQVVDPNRPVGWRYVYALLEDAKGARHPVEHLRTWKLGDDPARRFLLDPADDALVLPQGYLAR